MSSCTPEHLDSPFPFLKLPAEIRNKIHKLLLGDRVIHIYIPEGRIINHRLVWSPRYAAYVHKEDFPLLTLLEVCKDIHKETSLLPFASNVFEVYGGTVVEFLQALTPAQLGSLRALTVHVRMIEDRRRFSEFYDRMQPVAQKLVGLEDLRLKMSCSCFEPALKSLLVELVEAWCSQKLKVGIVSILTDKDDKATAGEVEEFAEELSQRLMATGR